jgi:ubiquinone/menaquinone biosynthesis C-methylase UbiE
MKLFLITLVALGSLSAQVATEANKQYTTKEGRAAMVPALDSPDRDIRQKPKELVAALSIKEGMTVVDLGTGPGYMLPFLSAAAGVEGRVIAEDIQSDFIEKARAKAEKDHLSNVEFILGTETDPKLPPRSADLILVLDVYHHFDYPDKMLAAFRAALKPGGRLAIVEYHKKRGAMGGGDPDRALTHIRASAEEVEKEVQAAGFKLLWRRDHVPDSQYIAIFQR